MLWKLYEKFPSIQREYADVKPLWMFTTEPFILITTKKPVKSMGDMKGLKIRMGGGPQSDQIRALGANPVLVPMAESYVALDNGVVDGGGFPWEAIMAFRFHEVVRHYTVVPMSVGHLSLAMNKAKWNSLPQGPPGRHHERERAGGIEDLRTQRPGPRPQHGHRTPEHRQGHRHHLHAPARGSGGAGPRWRASRSGRTG